MTRIVIEILLRKNSCLRHAILVLAILALSLAASPGQNPDRTAFPPNHLIYETSLYLRLHVHNPVDWYPWGPEALERARRDPTGFPLLLSAQVLYLTPPLDLTLVGDPNQPGTRELIREIHRRFLPERRLVLKNPKTAVALEKVMPGVKEYTMSGERPVAYICRSSACLAPVHTPAALLAQIKQFDAVGTTAPTSEHDKK